jgi:transcriptional regulator
MYNPPAFQIQDTDTIVAFMRRYSFTTLVTNGPQGLLAAHVPLLVRQDEGRELPALFGHLARANPQWQEFDGSTQALVIFQGAHGYVSPSLYEVHPSVPTWNYQVVHAYGVPRVIDGVNEVRDHVLELVQQPKPSRASRGNRICQRRRSTGCSARS